MTAHAVETAPLNFPGSFCCNCGAIDCRSEIQDTRVTSSLLIARADTTFQLSIPVCVSCVKSTRRRPSGLVPQFLVWTLIAAVIFGALLLLSGSVGLPLWATEHLLAIAGGCALLLRLLFDRLRRPRPPQTSFYQPVRIRKVSLRFAADRGQLAFLKLGFTNHEYLQVFTSANRESIDAGWLAAVKA